MVSVSAFLISFVFDISAMNEISAIFHNFTYFFYLLYIILSLTTTQSDRQLHLDAVHLYHCAVCLWWSESV